jgi:phosphatidylglycerophosphate synthase
MNALNLDAALSAGQLGFVVLIALVYGARVAARGGSRSARVEKNGSSALLGRGPMEMAYWALQPLGKLCVRLGITANAITFASLALGIGAGVSIAVGHLGVAALLSTISALGDALDGLVARASGTSSNAGETLDAAVDRYNELAFCIGLAVWLRDSALWLTVALLALGASFMVSYSTAKAEALQVEAPRGAMRRTERAVYLNLGAGLVPLVALVAPKYATVPALAAIVLVAVVGNVSAVRRLAAIAALVRARDAALKSEAVVVRLPAPVSTAAAAATAAGSSRPPLAAQRTS